MAAADAAGLGVPQFDLSGPLPAGVTVLEASAGTGKTYTIAALASRFIAEGAARLDELLLVTFTRVATSELRERVRERLVATEAELGRLVNGAPASQADPVVALLAAAPIEQVRARRERLAEALANFDAITIETTHGFCQSVLDGLGTLAESDPRVTFADDLDELLREVVDDLYIRRFHGHHDGPRSRAPRPGRSRELRSQTPWRCCIRSRRRTRPWRRYAGGWRSPCARSSRHASARSPGSKRSASAAERGGRGYAAR